MLNTRWIMVLVVLGLVASVPRFSAADCWRYYDPAPVQCFDANGCASSYVSTLCQIGCISGLCYNHGGSGECCGHLYYYAAGYPDGQDSCTQNGCGHGLSPVRRAKRSKPRQSTHPETVARGDVHRGGPVPFYGPRRMLFVPDQCSKSYGVLMEGDFPLAGGGH